MTASTTEMPSGICYSYVRFSSAKQKLGGSLTRQVAMSEQWAKDHGMTLDTTLKLRDEGIPAFRSQNFIKGALGEFIRAVDAGNVSKGSYLLIESFDRLSRDEIDEAFDLFRSILKKGINIVTLQDGQVFTSQSLKDIGKIIISLVLMSRAHEESATKSNRLKIRWHQRRENIGRKKIDTRFPSWLELNSDRSKFKVIPSHGKIVRKIFEDYHSGNGVVTIASELNQRGIPCISGRSKIWKTHYIQQLLKSRAVIGEYQPKKRGDGNVRLAVGPVITDYFPPVVSSALFYKVAAKLEKIPAKRGRHSPVETNLFAGKLFCPYCGEKMFIHYGKSSKRLKDGTKKSYGSIRTITCVAAKNGKCLNFGWRLDEFEKSFLELSHEIQVQFAQRLNTVKPQEAVDALERRLSDAKRRLSYYVTEFEVIGKKPATFMDGWNKAEEDVKSLEAEHKKAKAEAILSSKRNPYTEVKKLAGVDEITPNDRIRLASIIRATVERIDVYFVGENFNMARATSEVSRRRKSGINPTKIAMDVRKKLSIDTQRFFVAHLQWAGLKGRLMYPRMATPLHSIPDEYDSGRFWEPSESELVWNPAELKTSKKKPTS